jgi:two-component system sensor histidine kinase HydH
MVSPFIAIGVLLIMFPIFAFMTLDRMETVKTHIKEQLVIKGISLIQTFEAGTRTGMLSLGWGQRRIQTMLQETALQPDVAYIMIVTEQGTVLAHSDPSRVGRNRNLLPDFPAQTDKLSVAGYRIRSENSEQIFEVFKWFTPLRTGMARLNGMPMSMHGGMHGRNPEPEKAIPSRPLDLMDFSRSEDAIIIVGFTMDQASRAQAGLVREAIGRGILLFVLGCAGVLILTTFQAYRTTKARLISVKALSEKLKKEVETTRHLAAIGKLAGGVAHEIRNPLSSIKGFAVYFEKRYADHPDDRETAKIMVQEVERINRSVTQLLEFAKPVAVDKKEVAIREMISHSLKLVALDLKKKSITVHVDFRSGRSMFYTDPDRVNQILLNLYMNSLAAMDDGGTLTVTVMDVQPGQDLEIRVMDDGCGMDEQILSEIFDPYFTTRPDGTGLGLSIVHRLVESLGGEIRVKSAKGKGTTVSIYLK